jgi:hypothetical protein
MRQDLTNLTHHPDETFRTLSWTELFRLDAKLEKSAKSGRKLTEKMAKNLEKMKKNPVRFEAGDDNRSNILHGVRFLGGHTCANTEIWLKAREHIGISGIDPISRYDTEGVGMNGNMNSHLWATLHNPGSKELSIKMLSPEALKMARGSPDSESMACKKDFGTVHEIRVALATLRTATQFIHPWNFSFTTLEYFLNSVQFGEKEFNSVSERVNFVTNFVDDIISHNAEAWDDSKPFLAAHEISTKWVAEIMLKAPKTQNRPMTKQNRQKDSFDKDSSKGFRVPAGVCKRYNNKTCPSQNEKTCPSPWNSNVSLKHACAWQLPDKTFCMKEHPSLEHIKKDKDD